MNQALVQELFEYQDGTLLWKVALARRVKVGDRADLGHTIFQMVDLNKAREGK